MIVAGGDRAKYGATSNPKEPVMMMNRRAFSAALVAGAATASLVSARGLAAPAAAATMASTKIRNLVLAHGLFADGSAWAEVIARLPAAGKNGRAAGRERVCPDV